MKIIGALLLGLSRFFGGPVGSCIIIIQFTFAFYAVHALRYCYRYYNGQRQALADLASPAGSGTRSASPQLNRLFQEYDRLIEAGDTTPDVAGLVSRFVGSDSVLCIQDDSTGSAIGDRVRSWFRRPVLAPSIVRFVGTSLVGLGLLGTFLGFMLSLGGLSNSLETMRQEYARVIEQSSTGTVGSKSQGSALYSGGGSQEQPEQRSAASTSPGLEESLVSSVLKEINRPLGGMHTAFMTSVVGLILSMALGLLQILAWNYPNERKQFISELKAFLRADYQKRKSPEDRSDGPKLPIFMQQLLLATNTIAACLQQRMDSGFKSVGSELYQVSSGLKGLLSALNQIVNKFEKASLGMQDVTRAMNDYASSTNEAVERLHFLIEASQNDSKLVSARLGEILVPMERFSEASAAVVDFLGEQEARIERTGQELLGVLSSQVADVRRITTSLESLSGELLRQLGQLPDQITRSSAEALHGSIGPIISDMMEQVRASNHVIRETLALVKEYGQSIGQIRQELSGLSDAAGNAIADKVARVATELASSTDARYREQLEQLRTAVEELYQATLDALAKGYNVNLQSVTASIVQVHSESVKRVSEAANALAQFARQLDHDSKVVAHSSSELIRELRAVFALDGAEEVESETAAGVAAPVPRPAEPEHVAQQQHQQQRQQPQSVPQP